MESHLTALQATLASINGLHERQRQKRNYQPFTAAILNTHHLEVEDYIRDADQLENNLFWYPPAPGASSSSAPSSSKDRLDDGQKQQQQPSEGDLLAPRLPEPREFVPPTPLKKQAKEAEAKGLVTFDARTLLKAAQKLLDNYHNAPRARKHIKTLLKRHAEIKGAVAQHRTSLADSESLIARLSNPNEAQATVTQLQRAAAEAARNGGAGNGSKQQQSSIRGSEEEKRELEMKKRLQEQLQVEEMEIFALEQQKEELLERKQRMEAKKRTSASDDKAGQESDRSVVQARTTSQKLYEQSEATMHQNAKAFKGLASQTPATAPNEKADNETRRAVEENEKEDDEEEEEEDADETVRLNPSQRLTTQIDNEDDEDMTASAKPPAPHFTEKVKLDTPTSAIAPPVHQDRNDTNRPQVTEELERITSHIWKSFGSYMRFAAPNRESASYYDTLQVLDDVALCKRGATPATTNVGDESIASSAVTDATSGSTTSGVSASSSDASTRMSSLYDAGSPTPLTIMSAHLLAMLLRSAEPHEKPIDDIKADGKKWWSEVGKAAYEQSGFAPQDSQEHKDQGDDIAFKTVFNLHGKKVLRIKYQDSVRIVTLRHS